MFCGAFHRPTKQNDIFALRGVAGAMELSHTTHLCFAKRRRFDGIALQNTSLLCEVPQAQRISEPCALGHYKKSSGTCWQMRGGSSPGTEHFWVVDVLAGSGGGSVLAAAYLSGRAISANSPCACGPSRVLGEEKNIPISRYDNSTYLLGLGPASMSLTSFSRSIAYIPLHVHT